MCTWGTQASALRLLPSWFFCPLPVPRSNWLNPYSCICNMNCLKPLSLGGRLTRSQQRRREHNCSGIQWKLLWICSLFLGIWFKMPWETDPFPSFVSLLTLPHLSLPSSCLAVFSLHMQYHGYSSQHWGCWHPPGRSGHHGHCANLGRPAHWRYHAHHSCGLVPVSAFQTLVLSVLEPTTLPAALPTHGLLFQQGQSSRILEWKGGLGEYPKPCGSQIL